MNVPTTNFTVDLGLTRKSLSRWPLDNRLCDLNPLEVGPWRVLFCLHENLLRSVTLFSYYDGTERESGNRWCESNESTAGTVQELGWAFFRSRRVYFRFHYQDCKCLLSWLFFVSPLLLTRNVWFCFRVCRASLQNSVWVVFLRFWECFE